MKKVKIILSIILISVVLLACLGFLGYFGVKSMRRSRLRIAAREAFAAEDWKKAETLLKEYVQKDPNSEEDYVRLAQVYKHFCNTEKELHCWYKASTLNPLKPEYWDNYTSCALNARNFGHLYSTLNRKLVLGGELAPKDRICYLICAVMTRRNKEAEKFYGETIKADPEAFRKDELGRFAEFLVTSNRQTPVERTNFINDSMKSDNPFVRTESILRHLLDLEYSEEEMASIREKEEKLLKQAVELNRFVAIPFLANVYFSQMKFDSVIEIAEPYLADIDSIPLSVIYAESCLLGARPEKLKPLAGRFRSLGGEYRFLASYFDALYDFSQGVEKNDDLVRHMHEVNGVVQTNLVKLIELQIALNSDTMDKICNTLETLMMSPPFYDLQERACSAVRHYMGTKIEENPKLVEDPRMIKLALILSSIDKTDPLLMRITIADMRKRNVLTSQILQDNLEVFPDNPYLLQVAAEYELFNGDLEKCLEYAERFYALENDKRSIVFDFLHMLALELSGKVDEATKEYTALVENNEMDRGILFRYFLFCIDHGRKDELTNMAARLDASDEPELKALAPFFRVESLLLQEKTDDALSVLETAKTDHPDFALRAANLCSTYELVDQALSRYLALLGNHPDQLAIKANIAEVYLAKDMKTEALSYAKQAWEMDHDNRVGQFVYAKMLVANGLYQDADKTLKIPRRKIELPDEVRDLWTDIMLHCVREDLANGQFQRALDKANHYLILFPQDQTFQEFKSRAEQELKKASAPRNQKQERDPSAA